MGPIARCRVFIRRIKGRPFAVALLGIAVVILIGVVVASTAYFVGDESIQAVGIFITICSGIAAFAFFLFETYSLARISESIEKVFFTDVTLKIFSEIRQYTKLSRRMREGRVDVKKSFGEALREIEIDAGDSNLLEHLFWGHRVFIESGSTYAYLALTLDEYIQNQSSKINDQNLPMVCTNNILAFMVLLFQERCRVGLYPGTPAEGKYGATYGAKYDLIPDATSIKYDELEGVLDDVGGSGVQIIFLASSKVHLKCGPHTGSAENAVFKRCLTKYATSGGRNVPIILMIDSSKIEPEGFPIDPRACHPVYLKGEDMLDPHPRSESWDTEGGFTKFADHIASGIIFLFVGVDDKDYDRVLALRTRLQTYNTDRSPKIGMKVFRDGPIEVFAAYSAAQDVASGEIAESLRSALQTRSSLRAEGGENDEAADPIDDGPNS